MTLLTLLVATFDTLDVVVDAPLLDQLDTTGSIEAKQRRLAVEAKTEALLNAIIAPVMQVVGGSQLRMVTGMLGLLLDRNDINSILRSKVSLPCPPSSLEERKLGSDQSVLSRSARTCIPHHLTLAR